MKLIHISVHFEFAEIIEGLLDACGIAAYTRFSMVEGKDCDGKHMGSQVYPGNITVFQAVVHERQVEPVFDALKAFQNEKKSHLHLRALLIPIEKTIGVVVDEGGGSSENDKRG